MRDLILFLVIGLVAGWLAGKIMKGRGFGLIGNLIVGVIGSVLGGYLFSLIGLGGFGWLAGHSPRRRRDPAVPHEVRQAGLIVNAISSFR